MDSTMTCCVCLNMEVFHQSQTTFSWVTMLIEGSNPLKPSVCCWPTRSSTQKTSFFWEATMNAPLLTASTASTTSANGAITSSYGRHLQIVSTAYPWRPLLTKKFSVATAVSAPISRAWNRFAESWDRQTYPIRDFCVTFCGPILTRTRWAGEKTTEESALHLVRKSSLNSFTNTTWIWFAEPIR